MPTPKNRTPVTREQFRDMLTDFTGQLAQQVKRSLTEATQQRKQTQYDSIKEEMMLRGLKSLFKRSL